METILIIVIILGIGLIIYIKFLDYALKVNNSLVRLECDTHRIDSNENALYDILEDKGIIRGNKKNKTWKDN